MFDLKVRGYEGLIAQLEALGAELAAKALRTAARKAFQPVYDTAHRLALPSMDTGALLDAIKLTVVKPKDGDTVVAVGITIGGKVEKKFARARKLDHRPPSRRWHFVEFGTVHMAAKPFLRPALDQNADAVIEILKQELVKGIQRAVKKKASGKS